MAEKGVVITRPMIMEGTTLTMIGAHEDYWAHEMRRYLTYWDRVMFIDVPGLASMFGFRGPMLNEGDQDVITQLGLCANILIGNPYDISFNSNTTPLEVVAHQFSAVATQGADIRYDRWTGLDAEWAIGQGVTFISEDNAAVDELAFGITLAGALPVPGPEVKLGDILDFKHDSQNRIEEFRTKFRTLWEDAVSSDDPQASLVYAMEEIDDILLHIESAMRGDNLRPIRESVRSIAQPVINFAGGASLIDWLVPGSSVGFQLLGGAATAYLSNSYAPKPTGLPDSIVDYAYISRLQQAFPTV
jgi:hypothetical protein